MYIPTNARMRQMITRGLRYGENVSLGLLFDAGHEGGIKGLLASRQWHPGVGSFSCSSRTHATYILPHALVLFRNETIFTRSFLPAQQALMQAFPIDPIYNFSNTQNDELCRLVNSVARGLIGLAVVMLDGGMGDSLCFLYVAWGHG